ncbi:hypothetical protein [Glycomyces buryatensis]|uniref:Uncharacterized protein n=1 Tax=Glycomyces buryatensis TaxID=2570927 RepID=A0A4S8QAF8_9ACTN|nr:hypothetical protein [Glycomyces buryatensis]THV41473.1 hypothetical protein FAB82_11800 [Glycomyces buryatensis]
MTGDGIEYQVTEGPAIDAQLRQRHREGASSRELGEYATSLGLTPPLQDEQGAVPSVVFEFPPGDTEGVLVWDVPEPGEDQADDDDWGDGDSP